LPDVHARVLQMNGGTQPYMDFLVWSSLATGADLPAVSAPVMRSDLGLPLGVQIIAAEGEDRTAIAVAGMIEQATGGFVAPTILKGDTP
jgi:amidase